MNSAFELEAAATMSLVLFGPDLAASWVVWRFLGVCPCPEAPLDIAAAERLTPETCSAGLSPSLRDAKESSIPMGCVAMDATLALALALGRKDECAVLLYMCSG